MRGALRPNWVKERCPTATGMNFMANRKKQEKKGVQKIPVEACLLLFLFHLAKALYVFFVGYISLYVDFLIFASCPKWLLQYLVPTSMPEYSVGIHGP